MEKVTIYQTSIEKTGRMINLSLRLLCKSIKIVLEFPTVL